MLFAFVGNVNAERSIIGSNVSAGNLNNSVICSTFSGCTAIYIGDRLTTANLVMDANLNLTCLGPIQLIDSNKTTLDFSTGNSYVSLGTDSSIITESPNYLLAQL